MRISHIYPLALVLAVLFVGSSALLQRATPGSPVSPSLPPVVATSSPMPSAPSSPVVTPVPKPTPVPQPSPSIYTLAQVAKHASASDCWTAINGTVYNLTPFVPQHPGGERIVAVCGKDGTNLFAAQHGSNRAANAELATLKIGALAP